MEHIRKKDILKRERVREREEGEDMYNYKPLFMTI